MADLVDQRRNEETENGEKQKTKNKEQWQKEEKEGFHSETIHQQTPSVPPRLESFVIGGDPWGIGVSKATMGFLMCQFWGKRYFLWRYVCLWKKISWKLFFFLILNKQSFMIRLLNKNKQKKKHRNKHAQMAKRFVVSISNKSCWCEECWNKATIHFPLFVSVCFCFLLPKKESFVAMRKAKCFELLFICLPTQKVSFETISSQTKKKHTCDTILPLPFLFFLFRLSSFVACGKQSVLSFFSFVYQLKRFLLKQ